MDRSGACWRRGRNRTLTPEIVAGCFGGFVQRGVQLPPSGFSGRIGPSFSAVSCWTRNGAKTWSGTQRGIWYPPVTDGGLPWPTGLPSPTVGFFRPDRTQIFGVCVTGPERSSIQMNIATGGLGIPVYDRSAESATFSWLICRLWVAILVCPGWSCLQAGGRVALPLCVSVCLREPAMLPGTVIFCRRKNVEGSCDGGSSVWCVAGFATWGQSPRR